MTIPYTVDTLVNYLGGIYFIDEVLEGGDDPLYRLRRTANRHLPSFRLNARHSQLVVRGGVLN